MTPHIKHSSTLALFILLAVPFRIFAAKGPGDGDDDIKKQKLINKSYNVSAGDQLKIDNMFGNVVVSTWDKDQITVDIEIEAHASTEENATALLDQLNVKDEREGNTISFKTDAGHTHDHDSRDHDNNNGNDNKSKHKDKDDKHFNSGFHIDYVIHMPGSNRLYIKNQFGKIEVPDFKGPVSLFSMFGSLNTGKLDNVDIIDVEFGKAYITSINGGKLIFRYSEEAHVQKLSGSIKFSSEFSHNVQIGITNDIRDLSVSESYSDIRIIVDKSISTEFKIHTSFGSFHNDSGIEIKEEKEDDSGYGPHFDKDYSGSSGDGKGKIKIRSSFGNIYLSNHPGEKTI